jgi:heptaprenyl diphosphate synthase
MAVVRWERASLGEGFARLEERLREGRGELTGLAVGAVRRALRRRGDRLPAGLLLAASHGAGAVTEASIDLALAVTALQAALRQHEAVREEGPEIHWRRGRWDGNNAAVMLGDYLMVLAYQFLPPGGTWAEELAKVMEAFCRAGLQESVTPAAELEEATQVEIARGKRGGLLAFCGQAGARAGGATEAFAAVLAAFGERVGTAQYLASRGWCPEQQAALGRAARGTLVGLPDGEAVRWLMTVVGRARPTREPRKGPLTRPHQGGER